MNAKTILLVGGRNLLGLVALMGIHFASDYLYFGGRMGIQKISPYLYLLLLYGWMVVHNRVLFERYYLRGKLSVYLTSTLLFMVFASINMRLILVYSFGEHHLLPRVLGIWVYTFAGLGIYVMFRHFRERKPGLEDAPLAEGRKKAEYLDFLENGQRQQIPLAQILYVESLENYIKVITPQKTRLVRMSLKEAEERLPKPGFLRISRSHLVNTSHGTAIDSAKIQIHETELKVGKVYKRYVEEHLTHFAAK